MENLLKHDAQNVQIKSAIKTAIEGSFPIESNGRRFEVSNVEVEDTISSDDFPLQKEIKLARKS